MPPGHGVVAGSRRERSAASSAACSATRKPRANRLNAAAADFWMGPTGMREQGIRLAVGGHGPRRCGLGRAQAAYRLLRYTRASMSRSS